MTYLSDAVGSIHLHQLNRRMLNQVINAEGKLKTRELRKSIIDTFIEWCVKEKLLSDLIETEVYKSRADQNQNNILTINEYQLQILLAGIDNGIIRDIINVGFYMGLRISELVHCRPAWIVNSGQFLRIGDMGIWNLSDEFHPKSQKEHDTPIAIPGKVKRVFQRYADAAPYSRMFGYANDSTLRYNLKPYFQALPKPLSDNFTSHHLRHSCISYWLNEKRVPIQEVQRLARHARMETTMKYYHPDNEAHLEAFR